MQEEDWEEEKEEVAPWRELVATVDWKYHRWKTSSQLKYIDITITSGDINFYTHHIIYVYALHVSNSVYADRRVFMRAKNVA